MNNLYNNLTLVDLKNKDGHYLEIPINVEANNISFKSTNNNQFNIVNNSILFDGTFGLISNDYNIINFKNNIYIEFNISISDSSSNRSDGLQYIFDLTDSSNKKVNAFGVSVIQKFAAFYCYNNSDQPYTIHHVYYDFKINEIYNFKIIKHNNYMYIYVNNNLKYKSSSFIEATGTGVPGPVNENYNNALLKLGQFKTTSDNSNLKGSLSNFKAISFMDIDNILKKGSDTYYENLLLHIPFDYIESVPYNHNSYYPIINISNNDLSLYRPNMGSSKHFFNIESQLFWWYKGTNHRISINDNIIKNNNNFSILFKMYTSNVLTSGSIIDTKEPGTDYNNITISISADTSTFTLRYSTATGTATSWTNEYVFKTGILEPNTEYLICFTRNNNIFKLIIDSIEIESITIDFSKINWKSNVTYFFNNTFLTAPCPHYIRDLRIYNQSNIINPGSIDTLKNISIKNDYIYNTFINNKDLIYYTNTKLKNVSLKYDNVAINDNKNSNFIYIYSDINKNSSEFLLISEGFLNKTIYLYLNNILINKAKGILKFNITNNIKNYSYKIEGSNLIRKLPDRSMIPGYIEVHMNNSSCEGTDLYIRLYNSDTGEFIGDYNLINNKVTINNLHYLNSYDVMLIDKNKKIENKIRSRVTPQIKNYINPNECIIYLNELSYNEAILKYTKDYIDTFMLKPTLGSFYTVDAFNTNNNILDSIIMLYENNTYKEIGRHNIKYFLKVKSTFDKYNTVLYIEGNGLNLIKIGSILKIGNELLYVESFSYNKFIVKRGINDSFPEHHVTDSIIIIRDESFYNNTINTNINIKALSVDNKIISEINSVNSHSLYIKNRLYAPLPPANIKINGVYNLLETDTTNKLILTWDHRNHSVLKDYYDNTTVTNLDDNVIYRLAVYKIDKNNKETLFLKENIGTVTTYTINLSTDITIFKYRIILSSIKNGTIESYYNYDHIINTYFTPPFNITVTTI